MCSSWLQVLPRLRTDTQSELFFEKFKLLGLGRQIGPKNVGAFWVFLAELQSLSDGVRITQK